MITVNIGNTKTIWGYSFEEKNRIKDDLTIANPMYAKAKKYAKYVGRNFPKYLTYYQEAGGEMVVPAYYEIPFENEIKEDSREEVTVKYPPFLLQMRETQQQALNAYLDNPEKGIIVMPTGKGKTILGLKIASVLKQKLLVIVHKDDLVHGWQEDIKLCFGDKLSPGLIKARKRIIGEQITIATIQTLSRLSDMEWSEIEEEFGMIIIDECQHTPAESYNVINEFFAPYKIGLSATPERADGLSKLMQFYLGGICYQYKFVDDDEDILPVEVVIREVPIEYEPTVIYEGEEMPVSCVPFEDRPNIPFSFIETQVLMNNRYMETVLTDVLREVYSNRSVLLFLTQKEHCRAYFDALVARGISAEKMQMFYGDATESNALLKEKAETGEAQVTIATLAKASEGTNVKAWEVAFLVTSMNDGKNVEQAIGRIRRAKEGKLNPVRVYDYRLPKVYILKNHGFNRDKRYRQLGFQLSRAKGLVMTRGSKI